MNVLLIKTSTINHFYRKYINKKYNDLYFHVLLIEYRFFLIKDCSRVRIKFVSFGTHL